jgi:hypothetical protein
LGIDKQQRVAVGRGMYDLLGGDIPGGAWPNLDDELLAEML